MKKQFFPNILPKNTANLINVLTKSLPKFLDAFYLSGGTALSLQFGHRESEDLDFFSQAEFDPGTIEEQLSAYGKLSDVQKEAGTLNAFLIGVKLQFLEYPYELIEPLDVWKGIRISSVLDIACTKLQTISMRGSKKDFVDLYFILDNYSLPDLFSAMKKKYKDIDYSQTHILKSLVYFEDAEVQPMPKMQEIISWENVKKKIIDTTRTIKFT